MCMYCERRKDVSFGWMQPEIPTSGNLDAKYMHVQIMDYQSAQPEIQVTSKELNELITGEKDGICTLVIPANYCIVCGRKLGNNKNKLGNNRNFSFEQHAKLKTKVPQQLTMKDIINSEDCYRKTHPGTKSAIMHDDNGKPDELILHVENNETYHIRLKPHTIGTLKALIKTPETLMDSGLRKYADMTARLLMSIDQNMLLSISGIRWSDKKLLDYEKDQKSHNRIIIDISDIETNDNTKLFQEAAFRTLAEVRRLGLQNPLLNPEDYPESLSLPENIHRWTRTQMHNIEWPDVTFARWV